MSNFNEGVSSRVFNWSCELEESAMLIGVACLSLSRRRHRTSISAILRAIWLAAVVTRRLVVAEFFLVNTLSAVAPHERRRTRTTSTDGRKLVGRVSAVVDAVAEWVGEDTDVCVGTDDHVVNTSDCRADVASLVWVVAAIVVSVAEIVASDTALSRRTATHSFSARSGRRSIHVVVWIRHCLYRTCVDDDESK